MFLRTPASSRRAARHVLLAAGLAILPGTAQAQDTQLRFDGVNGATAFGYHVGPFAGTLLRPGVATSLTMFCVDLLNAVTLGQTQAVNITSLAGSDLSATRRPGQLEAYRKAAWLTTQFDPAAQPEWGGIQAAIWEIMAPGTPDGGTSVTNTTHEAYWLQQANLFVASAGYASYDWSRFFVLTDVNAAGTVSGVGMQEFITHSANVVPEPETWMMLGGGLAALGVIAWRRRAAA